MVDEEGKRSGFVRVPPSDTETTAGSTEEMSDASQKNCPLLSAGLIAGVGKNRTLPCRGSSCAWWSSKEGCCVVVIGH